MPAFPSIGVQAVVLGAENYLRQLDAINKKTEQVSKGITASTSKAGSVGTSAFDRLGTKIQGLASQFDGFLKQTTGLDTGLSSLFGNLPAGTLGITAMATAAAAAATAFLALGVRGAALTGLANSFDALNQRLGVDSIAALARLREAAAGTVSDFELIRLSNLALAGAAGEFGTQFGRDLPRLLEIARVQAQATGQSVDFLFQSLITGIKRGSPLLIDNTGLVLSEGKANELYAESIGKTVEQLTAEEKQIALLNATLAAGQVAIDTFAGAQEGASVKLARMNATLANMADSLALAVQPAFGQIVDVVNRFLVFIQDLLASVTPLIGSLLELGAAIITGPLNAIMAILEPIGKLISFLLRLVTVIVQPVINAFTAMARGIADTVGRTIQFLGEVVQFNFGLNFDNLALNLGRGAGAAFGAFANAIIQVANEAIFPAVIAIATFIADFLAGQSPPPRGPLSRIDEGGANTMLAFLDGMLGVSLDPVEQVAAEVNAALGAIGQASAEAVKRRLLDLDIALEPFAARLEIVKNNFDAIAKPAQMALDAIDRQMETALAALASGEAGSAEAVRALDAQRETIQNALSSQQNLVDSAQIQLALAQAQQSEERTLLGIRQRQLGLIEGLTEQTQKAADATKEGVKAAGDAAAKAGGMGAAAPGDAPATGAAAGGGFAMPSVGDLITGQSAVDQMGADLSQGFQEGIVSTTNQAGLQRLQQNQAALGTQLQRIGSADIGARISSSLSGLATAFQDAFSDASVHINDFVDSVTNPDREGSIPFGLNNLGNLARDSFTTFSNNLNTGLLDAQTYATTFVSSVFDPGTEGSIPYAINAFSTGLIDQIGMIRDTFQLQFDLLLNDTIIPFIDSVLNPETEGSIPYEIAQIPIRATEALASLGQVFQDLVVTPVSDAVTTIATNISTFFVGTGEGSLGWIINQGVQFFIDFPGRIMDALTSLATAFYSAVAIPIIGGINAIIEGLEQLVNDALIGLANLFSQLQGVADAAGQGDAIRGIIASLSGGISIPRVPYPPMPGQAQGSIGGARKGGLFSEGMLQTHGNELISSASKLAVFPASFTRSLDNLASILMQPQQMAMPAGGTNSSTYNNSSNMTINLNGQQSNAPNAQQLAIMRLRNGRR